MAAPSATGEHPSVAIDYDRLIRVIPIVVVRDGDLVGLLCVALGTIPTLGSVENALVALVVPFGGQHSTLVPIVSGEDTTPADAVSDLAAAAAELVPVGLFLAAAVVARGAQLGEEGAERGQGHGDDGQARFGGGPEEEVSRVICRLIVVLIPGELHGRQRGTWRQHSQVMSKILFRFGR